MGCARVVERYALSPSIHLGMGSDTLTHVRLVVVASGRAVVAREEVQRGPYEVHDMVVGRMDWAVGVDVCRKDWASAQC